MNSSSTTNWLADLVYVDGRFQRGLGLVCDSSGQLMTLQGDPKLATASHEGLAILPGLVNAHSHAFQRVLRGRTEYRTGEGKDSFWTWREMMYRAAGKLTPEDLYDCSRMAFLEMALNGITAVGEFHYIHHAPNGTAYDDPNLLAKEVVRAARDIGLRITLLRVAYARSGFETALNPLQKRFIEKDVNTYLTNAEQLISDLREDDYVQIGIAPHSVRAVPLSHLSQIIAFANQANLVVHMHVAEQPQEVSACIAEYGRSPVALLETEGLLSSRFTAVHAIYVTEKGAASLSAAEAIVCACPTTERNLGDGVVPADIYFRNGIRVAVGTDGQSQIDLLEDARELEYHLRLQKVERVVLGGQTEGREALATQLFKCATINGAESIGFPTGSLGAGKPADFFTVDLNDPSIAGSSEDDLLSNVVFSGGRTAIRDVVVGGKKIVSDGRHVDQDEIVRRFGQLQKRLWGTD